MTAAAEDTRRPRRRPHDEALWSRYAAKGMEIMAPNSNAFLKSNESHRKTLAERAANLADAMLAEHQSRFGRAPAETEEE